MRRFFLAAAPVVFAVLLVAPARADDCSPVSVPQGLERFHAAMEDVEAGERSKPLTVLHLGDSHISLDTFTRGLRQRWQARFGDAGRGLMPGVPFRYYAPDGYDIEMEGAWNIASSLPRDASGPFGIQGFRVSSGDDDAIISLRSDNPVSAVEIEAYGGPDTGALLLKLGEAAPLKLPTRQAVPGLVRFRVPAANVHEIRLVPAGTGTVHLLGWAILSPAKPGVRYDSHGVVAATASITTRWDKDAVRAQVAAMNPDLVILGFGTNEGFNNGLDIAAYGAELAGFIDLLMAAAPGSSLALLGPFDGARQGAGETCGGGWTTPPKLDAVRSVLANLAAARGAFFWDGGAAMGGRCSADEWARAEPPLMYADRVHLRAAGAERLSAQLWNSLMGLEENVAESGACHADDAPD
ncbi:MAG: GDSL-type esterase/lipase family protein [Parvibaculum sp.]